MKKMKKKIHCNSLRVKVVKFRVKKLNNIMNDYERVETGGLQMN